MHTGREQQPILLLVRDSAVKQRGWKYGRWIVTVDGEQWASLGPLDRAEMMAVQKLVYPQAKSISIRRDTRK
jgi:hypothetical protein